MKEKYDNGTHTEYTYDPARRWLRTIKTQNKGGIQFQNMSYEFDPVGNVNGYKNDCLDSAHGNYKTCQNYEYDGLYQLIRATGETTYNPYKSPVPEYTSSYEQKFEFDADGLGNMMKKTSSEKVSPKRTIGDNLNYTFNYEYDPAYAHRLKNVGNMYYLYDANGNVICEQDGSFESNGDGTSYRKITEEAENVYSSNYGWGLWREEVGGKSNGRYRRTYFWNERNKLVCSQDSRYTTNYIYGQDGQRTNKYTSSSETLYFNKMWTLHTDSGNAIYGGQNAKNIYLGDTRIVTKLAGPTETTVHEEFYKQYYYHSDHLGSASLISDYKGDEYQRIEYTPYGETWVEKTQNTGLEYLPYKFTAKELDEETGLYYYGARYLNPKYSRWLSCDPALPDYMSEKSNGSSGGIFNSINHNLYHYAGNNPLRYIDPTGRESGTSEEVTGAKIGEHICPEINIVITQSNEKNDSHNATKGSLSVYWKTDKDTSENGKLVLTVPTVSGGDGNESTKKGYYPNLPQESTNTSSNEILRDDKHGGNNNIMIRLPGTDGQAIHQGNNTVTQEGALTEGCIAVTATDLNFNNGKSDVDRNYEAFKNALCPYGYQGVRVNVTVK